MDAYLVYFVQPQDLSVLGTGVGHTGPSSVNMEMSGWEVLDWKSGKK